MAALATRFGPLSNEERLRGRPDNAYGALVRTIVGQQLSTKAARTIYSRVVALFEEQPPQPEHILAADENSLRAAGLSRPKVLYLKDLASRVVGGDLDLEALHHASDEQVIDRITAVKGLGRWSADMFMMFHLARPDVLPVGDLGVRRSVEQSYGLPELPDAKTLREIAEPWRPERTLASLYLWRSLDAVPVEK
jgi:DNA-3-methyladenine glycosylase II